jgi:hypothetical protein
MVDLDESINLRNIKKVLINKSNSTNIKYLYSWDYEDSTIMCYGCNNGSAGNENKHGLPPEGMKHIKSLDKSDTQLLFGDIFILMKQKSLCDFDTYDYGLFYSIHFDGFDDCVYYDSVSEDDNVSYYSLSDDNVSDDNGFIVYDNSEQTEEYIGDSDELDEDTNEY